MDIRWKRAKWGGALAGTGVYFALAWWLTVTHADLTPKGKVVVQLIRPFQRYNHANIDYPDPIARFDYLANDPKNENDRRSPIVAYENNTPLGPAHTSFADIYHLGAGRFSHWPGQIGFSASDNSDPN